MVAKQVRRTFITKMDNRSSKM